MKIAVVGCGALGTYYGAKLARSGHDTRFLLRSDFEAVQQRGVLIRSVDGDFTAFPRAARSAAEIGPCELVLIGLKTTANDAFPRLIPPLVNDRTLVVSMQNGLGNEETLAALLGPENILGGLCFVCLNRVQPGVVVHSAHGRIVLGEHRRPPMERTWHLAAMMRQAGILCDVAENLEAAHWEKLVWNVPFNGLGVAGCAGYEAVQRGRLGVVASLGPCLATDRLLDSGTWEHLVRELMWEIVAAARAKGFLVQDEVVESHIEKTRIMHAYKASTLIDFERGQPMELESMFLEPLRQGESAGARMPRLAALCRLLGELGQIQSGRGSGSVVG